MGYRGSPRDINIITLMICQVLPRAAYLASLDSEPASLQTTTL